MWTRIFFATVMTLASVSYAYADAESAYIPFYRDGVVRVYQQELYDMWAGDSHAGSRYTTHCFSHTAERGTVINGVEGFRNLNKMLLHYPDCPSMDFVCVDFEFTGYDQDRQVYESGGILRCYSPYNFCFLEENEEITPYIIYDFNLTAGDSFKQHLLYEDGSYMEGSSFYVTADEIIEVRDATYRRLTICDKNHEICDYWVEGIGSANSQMVSLGGIRASDGLFFYEPKLIAVYEDGKLIFEYDDFATANIISSVSNINDDDESEIPEAIYDLSGLPLPSEPKSGIYIRGGEKKLAR